MNSQPAPRRKAKNFLPEILIAGLIFVGGALFWSQNFTPQIAVAQPAQAPQPNWRDAPDKEKVAAQKIIVAQLEAFKADDWKKAVTFQSAGLKGNFASVEQFKQVIKTNYPQFASYKTVKFGKARIAGPLLQIQVTLTGKDGVQIAALYSMIREPVDPKKPKVTEYRVSGVSGGEANSGAKTV